MNSWIVHLSFINCFISAYFIWNKFVLFGTRFIPAPLHAMKNASSVEMNSQTIRETSEALHKLHTNGCPKCGGVDHVAEQCKFREYVCSFCDQIGHLRRMCPRKGGSGASHYPNQTQKSAYDLGHTIASRGNYQAAGRNSKRYWRGRNNAAIGKSAGRGDGGGSRGQQQRRQTMHHVIEREQDENIYQNERDDSYDSEIEEPMYQMSLSKYKPVSLTVLSYNLDSILSRDEIGMFRLREYTEVSNRHREVFVDFNSGFDAMSAQELLHDFELVLENGSLNRLKAKIIGSSPSKLPSLSPPNQRRSKSRDRHGLIPYELKDSIGFNIDKRLEMLEKYKKVVKAETELFYLKRKLRKEKKKYTRQQIESSETSDSDSSSKRKPRKSKLFKTCSKSKKRSKSLKNSTRSDSSDHEASCSFARKSKSQEEILSRTYQGRIFRSRSKELPPTLISLPSTNLRTPTRSNYHETQPKHSPIINTSRTHEDKRNTVKSRQTRTPISQTSRFRDYSIRHSKSRSPKFQRAESRSRTKKLRSISRSPKTLRRRSCSRSGSPGYRNVRNRFRKYSRSRSSSRHRTLRSPHTYRGNRDRRRPSENLISPPFSTHNRRDNYDIRSKIPQNCRKQSNSQANTISVNRVKNRIIELDSDDEKSTKSTLKTKPVITDEDHILILNKLEEASKLIVNEINIAVSFKYVAYLKVLNLKEKEQAITAVKKYVDDYLRQLIPQSMALAITVAGIVKNFRMSLSKEEENKLVEGIINDIVKDREKNNVVVKSGENSPMLASDWRAVDDLLRDIENEDPTEPPTFTSLEVIEKPEKKITENPMFYLPIKKIMKQMKAHIDRLDFKGDDLLELKFVEEMRKKIRERISNLLVGKKYVSTHQIVEIYKENYPLESDMSFVNEVYTPIVKGEDENEESTGNTKSASENVMYNETNYCSDSKFTNNNVNKDANNGQIKQEGTCDFTPNDVPTEKTTSTSIETGTEERQCNVNIIISTIIKTEAEA